MQNYLNIQAESDDLRHKIRQNMKFKTNMFIWKVKFNTPLNPKTVNSTNLYVTSSNQSTIRTAITYNTKDNTIEISPLDPYSQTETYTLHITTNVESKGGKNLRTPIKIKFKMN